MVAMVVSLLQILNLLVRNVSDLTISKTVTGDFADETKDFTFTITITGVADKTYNVYKKDKVIKTLTSRKSDTVTLKHGESVVIKGLEAADTYTVVETNEDYTPSINLSLIHI